MATQVFDDGSTLTTDDETGDVISFTPAPVDNTDTGGDTTGGSTGTGFNKSTINRIPLNVGTQIPTVPGTTSAQQTQSQNMLSKLVNGTLTSQDFLNYIKESPTNAASLLGGLANLNAQPQYNRVGYQGSIPSLAAIRTDVPYKYDPNRRPGSGGRQYFTDVQYTPVSGPEVVAAQTRAAETAKQIAAQPPQVPVGKAGGGLIEALNYFTKGGLDEDKFKNILSSLGSLNQSSYSGEGSNYSAPSTNYEQLLQALSQMQTGTPTQTQGTTPEQKPLSTSPLNRETGPEASRPKFADDELGLSEAAWKYIRDSQDMQNKAPDLASWGVDKSGNIYRGGGMGLNSDYRYITHYSDIPKEVFEKYVAKQDKDYTGAYEDLKPYAHWNRTEQEQDAIDHPEKYMPHPVVDETNVGPAKAAQGGLMGLARGRYLQGATDGMADKLPASIDGREPAKLSHGEFVVPADVVSHLGNGNSDAGAKKLYQMMDRIRMARTGTKKQGKQINPDKYMLGGIAGYAAGGDIKGYAGDTSGSLVNATSTTTPSQNVYESNLSSWAGPYVTNMLGKGQALAEMPYQAYQGPLTAGASGLQQQAFQNAANLQVPSSVGQATQTAGDVAGKMQGLNYAPGTFTSQFNAPGAYQTGQFSTDTFGAQQAQQYMNPYLQASLDPQIAEARRQAQITNLQNMSKLTQAGAYGGGRQAIMQAEADRNLASNLANITGQGYNTAYTNAMSQFNADQARKQAAQQATEQSRQFGAQQGLAGSQAAAQFGQAAQQAAEQSRQFGANYGLQGLQGALAAAQAQGALGAQQNQLSLQNLAQQAALGQQQRGIESEGIAADKAQFEEARDYPYKMLQFQQSLLSGLPLQTQAPVTPVTSQYSNFAQGYTQLQALLDKLNIPQTTTTSTTTP